MYLTTQELDSFAAAHPDLIEIDAMIIDLCGNAVGKRLPMAQARSMVENGTPICGAMQLVDVMGNTADPMGHGFSDGDPDAMARPLSGTLAPVPWSGGRRAQVLCELTELGTGKPFWYDPRIVLGEVCARFAELGLTPVLALELEFYLIDPERGPGGAPIPCRQPGSGAREKQGQVLSLAKLDAFDPVITALQTACKAQNLPITTLISEYGAGQFEINLAHLDDPLRAADHAALLRRAVQGAARAAGYDATFMSKPFPGESGNGLHIHLSLVDADGRNIFDPGTDTGEARLGHAVAGLQQTLHEAMAFFAPNVNVYRRFKPDEFTPVTRDWGENNRSVAIRIPPTTQGSARRLEHRVAGAEANPYLVTAAVLAGVHHGLSEELTPTGKHGGNAGAEVDESLPLTLWDALAALQTAEILPNYISRRYLGIYREVKQAEFTDFLDAISPREYDWYL